MKNLFLAANIAIASAKGLCIFCSVIIKNRSSRKLIYPFRTDAEYNVAMTSYRASGGGGLLKDGSGVNTDLIDERVVDYYPEIRNILYDYLSENTVIDPEVIGDETVIGRWSFVPEDMATKALERDMKLLFP